MHLPRPAFGSLKFWISTFILVVILPFEVNAQKVDTTRKPCLQKDLKDIIREWQHKPPKKNVNKNHSLLLIPSAGINPTSGFMLGVAGQYVTRDKKPHSLYSFVQGTLFVTTKKQLLFQVKSNLFTNHDRIFLIGDWRFFIFSQPTYGLGTKAPEDGVLDRHYNINGYDVADDSLVQPMKFNHIRFYEIAAFRIKNTPFFIGPGYHLDYFNRIEDERLDTANKIFTSHYTYSEAFGFNTKKYGVSGVSFNLAGDTRDNLANAKKGYFFYINWRLNPEFLGSAKNSMLLNTEWRSFHKLVKNNDRKILGFWFMGNFSPSGKLPYLALPSLGYDQRGRAGRGYVQGRFRGPNMIYGETEYRFPISKCNKLFSGVVFANFTTADTPNKSLTLFENVAPGVGAGLRVMVEKLSRSNLQIDFGVGRKSFGVYVGVGETF